MDITVLILLPLVLLSQYSHVITKIIIAVRWMSIVIFDRFSRIVTVIRDMSSLEADGKHYVYPHPYPFPSREREFKLEVALPSTGRVGSVEIRSFRRRELEWKLLLYAWIPYFIVLYRESWIVYPGSILLQVTP
jgi:hypothetical protein